MVKTVRSKKGDWVTISFPRDLAKRIDSFVESKKGNELGYRTKSNFIIDSAKEKLELSTGEEIKRDEVSKELSFLSELIIRQNQMILGLESRISSIEQSNDDFGERGLRTKRRKSFKGHTLIDITNAGENYKPYKSKLSKKRAEKTEQVLRDIRKEEKAHV